MNVESIEYKYNTEAAESETAERKRQDMKGKEEWEKE